MKTQTSYKSKLITSGTFVYSLMKIDKAMRIIIINCGEKRSRLHKLKNKKINLVVFIVFFICIFLPGWAQPSTKTPEEFKSNPGSRGNEKTEIQIFAGPSISFLRGNLEVDNTNQNVRNPKFGYSFGFALTSELNKKLCLTYGIMFEKKGSISNATVTYFDESDQNFKQGLVEYDYEYDYVTLPIQAFYPIGSTEKLLVGFGPYVSYLIKQTRARNPSFSAARELTDETELNTKLDFGIVATILFKIPLNTRISFNCQLTNALGLLNVRPNLYSGQVMKTNNTSLLIGLNTQ